MSPRISVITAVFDPPVPILRKCIESVRSQTLEDWEWCVVDDGSCDPAVVAVLREAAAGDSRIRLQVREANGGIVAASNDALAMAQAPWVAFLDHDDQLASDALASVLRAGEESDADLVYSDEQIVDAGGRVMVRHEKPAWSPTRLRSQMYTGHLCAVRTEAAREVGGFRPGFDGAQDYDLVLRVAERAGRVVHVPRVLYSWVQAERSTARDPAAKPWAFDAGVRVVQDHCDRVGLRADVEPTDVPGVHRLRWRFDRMPLVSIVIPTRGSSGQAWGAERCFVVEAVRSVVRTTTYPNYEVVVVADRDTPATVLAELEGIAGDRLVTVEFDGPFNFSRKCNKGVAASSGELLLLLNDDVEVISPDWIEALAGPFQEEDVGMTGALLLFESGLVQHAGQCVMGEAHHLLHGVSARTAGPMAALAVERECAGVTAACSLIRRGDFEAVGGLSEDFANNYNDVDLCMRVRCSLGKRIVWTPFARLWHFESSTRDPRVTPAELALLHERWPHEFARDPYFTPTTGDFQNWQPPAWR